MKINIILIALFHGMTPHKNIVHHLSLFVPFLFTNIKDFGFPVFFPTLALTKF